MAATTPPATPSNYMESPANSAAGSPTGPGNKCVTDEWVPETRLTSTDLLRRLPEGERHDPPVVAAADLPDVLQAPGLNRAADPIRHHEGHRDLGLAPPARCAPTVHPSSADDVDRSRADRAPRPTTPGTPTARAARGPGRIL